MTIGEYLKKLREQRGLSIKQVVIKTAGVLDKTMISRLEHDQRKLSLKTAYYLAEIYGVNLTELADKVVAGKTNTQDIPFNISNDEKKLVQKFRELPSTIRISFKNILYTLTGTIDDLHLLEEHFPKLIMHEGSKSVHEPHVVDYKTETTKEVE